ncbi:PadR family transcriptional regulator [Caenispirillum bisanense]|uniref:DNA-binding transcriptional regulator, PadR family n=1 Tax=Caenispirillum bisanense TaxID=414052 RepID=A0A286GJ55_9PROT|nr:PadR family transcriptional regulator [Caenispirillum bisanense]SOD95563.1 DNA-binding transcriptional regulator, PadR family [Caenispirillum bisanense]
MAKAAPDYTSRSYWNGIIKMSLSKFFILRVLHERPMHGYEIAQAVERTTSGCCSPSEGAIYPALKEFETGGYVVSETEVVSGRERRVYTLTDKGRDAFRTAVDAWMEVTDSLQAAREVVDRPRAVAGGGCCG